MDKYSSKLVLKKLLCKLEHLSYCNNSFKTFQFNSFETIKTHLIECLLVDCKNVFKKIITKRLDCSQKSVKV